MQRLCVSRPIMRAKKRYERQQSSLLPHSCIAPCQATLTGSAMKDRIGTMRRPSSARTSIRPRKTYAIMAVLVVLTAPAVQASGPKPSSLKSHQAFPDATTTGVPANVVLRPSKSLVIKTRGAIIDGLDISGSVTIEANDVVLQNCKVTGTGYAVVLIRPGISGTVIKNCEISNQGAGGEGIAGQGTFLRNNIHDCADGIDVRGNNTVIRDNYIHRMRGTADSHYDGIQADGGFTNLTIVHNTIINDQNQTSAVMIDNYWGPIDRVRIENNLLVGGAIHGLSQRDRQRATCRRTGDECHLYQQSVDRRRLGRPGFANRTRPPTSHFGKRPRPAAIAADTKPHAASDTIA